MYRSSILQVSSHMPFHMSSYKYHYNHIYMSSYHKYHFSYNYTYVSSYPYASYYICFNNRTPSSHYM